MVDTGTIALGFTNLQRSNPSVILLDIKVNFEMVNNMKGCKQRNENFAVFNCNVVYSDAFRYCVLFGNRSP